MIFYLFICDDNHPNDDDDDDKQLMTRLWIEYGNR